METEPLIVRDYIATGKVKLIYRHLLRSGQAAVRTAEASECAADQGALADARTRALRAPSEV